jgi:hypothetical protein
LNRRSGSNSPKEAHSAADAEAEAAITTAAIAGLCRLLAGPGVAEHPLVRRQLGKLEDLLAAIEQAGHSPGRHRAQAGERRRVRELSSLKPDPAAARTPAEYVTVLRQHIAWSGGASLRTIAARAKQSRVHSSIATALRRDKLPTLEVVTAIVVGCGGTEEDLRAFTLAWQRLHAAEAAGNADYAGPLPAPVPAFQLVTGI